MPSSQPCCPETLEFRRHKAAPHQVHAIAAAQAWPNPGEIHGECYVYGMFIDIYRWFTP